MSNNVLISRAWGAWDTLHRWEDSLIAEQADAKAIQTELNTRARVVFSDQPNPAYTIHSYAADVIEQHSYYLGRGENQEKHASAIAAWKQVLKTTGIRQMDVRLRVAIEATARVVRRARRILHPEEFTD